MTPETKGIIEGAGIMTILTPVIIYQFIKWIARDDQPIRKRKAHQYFVTDKK